MNFTEAFAKELESKKAKLIENKRKVKAESKVNKTEAVIKEDTEEYLEPRFDSRASFYKKAKVVTKDNGDEELYSYGTHVGGMRNGKPYSKGKWSQTTTRHQKEYFQQKGFDPKQVEVEENKKVTESKEEDELKELQDKLRGVDVSKLSDGEYEEYKKNADRVHELMNKLYDFKKVESKKLEERDRSEKGILQTINEVIVPELEWVADSSMDIGLIGLAEVCEEYANSLKDISIDNIDKLDENKKVEGYNKGDNYYEILGGDNYTLIELFSAIADDFERDTENGDDMSEKHEQVYKEFIQNLRDAASNLNLAYYEWEEEE